MVLGKALFETVEQGLARWREGLRGSTSWGGLIVVEGVVLFVYDGWVNVKSRDLLS